jgi:flagellar protein FlaG
MKSDGLSMLSQVKMAAPETNPSVEMRKAATGAPVRQDVSFDGRIQPQDAVQSLDSVIDAEVVAQAVQKIVSYGESLGRSLAISVDDRSGDFIVKVQNSSTDEVVRQIPSEEVLRIAAAIQEQFANLDLMGEEGGRGLLLEALA